MFSDDEDLRTIMPFRNYDKKIRPQRKGSTSSVDLSLDQNRKGNGLFPDPTKSSDYQKFDKDEWTKDLSKLRAYSPRSQYKQQHEMGEGSVRPPKTRHKDNGMEGNWRKTGKEKRRQAQMPPQKRFDCNKRNTNKHYQPRSTRSNPEYRAKRMSNLTKQDFFQQAEAELSDNEDEPTLDVEKFQNLAKLADFSEIDQDGLIRSLHRRFWIKASMWESRAVMYSRISFGMHVIILVIQVFLILSQHVADFFHISPSGLQTLQYTCAAVTAILVGLQMKLKLNEKCEKFRRGAKIYTRLKRATTYCLLLLDNGGKIEDVSMLWREAMSKEAKSIPTASMLMAH